MQKTIGPIRACATGKLHLFLSTTPDICLKSVGGEGGEGASYNGLKSSNRPFSIPNFTIVKQGQFYSGVNLDH